MALDRDLIDRARFFQAHAGYCTPPGRVACALASAHAERWAEWQMERGALTVEWRADDEYQSWGADEVIAWESPRLADGRLIAMGCIVTYREPLGFSGATIEREASLWGIVAESVADPYCRTIVADLIVEVQPLARRL